MLRDDAASITLNPPLAVFIQNTFYLLHSASHAIVVSLSVWRVRKRRTHMALF